MRVANEGEKIRVKVARYGAFYYRGERFEAGDELEIPVADYEAAQRLFQPVEIPKKAKPNPETKASEKEGKGKPEEAETSEAVGKGEGVRAALQNTGNKMVKGNEGQLKG